MRKNISIFNFKKNVWASNVENSFLYVFQAIFCSENGNKPLNKKRNIYIVQRHTLYLYYITMYLNRIYIYYKYICIYIHLIYISVYMYINNIYTYIVHAQAKIRTNIYASVSNDLPTLHMIIKIFK